MRLLPSVLTKHGLWKTYSEISTSQSQNHVGYSKFCDLWSQLCPFVLIMRPATDLCWTQKNNNLIQKTANLPKLKKLRPLEIRSNIFDLPLVKEIFIRTVVGRQRKVLPSILKELISASDANHVFTMALFITPTTTLSSCIIRQIRVTQDPFILELPGNVQSLECVVKLFQGRSTSSSMRVC